MKLVSKVQLELRVLNTLLIGIGVQQHEPVAVYAKGHANHDEQFRNAGNLCQQKLGGLPSLVVVVLPSGGAEIYRAIK